jgi:cbb3-type cytochrome oxidase maturation protein
MTFACPVCVGDPGSPMTQAAQNGVLFLLGVVVLLLAGIGYVAFSWARRAKQLAREEQLGARPVPPLPVGTQSGPLAPA